MSQEASGNSTESIEDIISGLTYDLRRSFDVCLNCAFDGDDGGEPNDGADGSADDGDGDDSDGSGGDSTDKPDAKAVKDPEKKRLSEEAARHRVAAKTANDELRKAQAKLKEIEDKDKSDLEKAQSDLKEASSRAEKLEAVAKTQAVKLAFFESGAAALFRSPTAALKLLRDDLNDLELEDDGTVDAKAIKDLATKLLKDEPYLGSKESDSEEDDDNDSGSAPSGRPMNGKRSKDELDRQALAKKFPALTRK